MSPFVCKRKRVDVDVMLSLLRDRHREGKTYSSLSLSLYCVLHNEPWYVRSASTWVVLLLLLLAELPQPESHKSAS